MVFMVTWSTQEIISENIVKEEISISNQWSIWFSEHVTRQENNMYTIVSTWKSQVGHNMEWLSISCLSKFTLMCNLFICILWTKVSSSIRTKLLQQVRISPTINLASSICLLTEETRYFILFSMCKNDQLQGYLQLGILIKSMIGCLQR